MNTGRGGGRGSSTIRLFKLIVMLTERPYSAAEAAEKLGVSNKTIYRDVVVMSEIGVPITDVKRTEHTQGEHGVLFRIEERGFIKKMLREYGQ